MNSIKYVAMLLILLLGSSNAIAQTTISSSNGWTATVTLTPTAVVPEFTNCQWYYHYEVRFNCKVDFTGSSSGRSLSANAYLTCSGGSGGSPYVSLGTFTSNTNTSFVTTNNSRQYNAVSSYNYGSNPDCNHVTLANVNCTTVRLDYWGSGVSSGSATFNLSAPLPVSLVYFNACNVDDYVNFNWSTASETNNDYFTIERSADGITFDAVTQIKGAGNSHQLLNYSSTDKNPLPGLSYYRLKQTDFNGDFQYSDIVAVSVSKKTGALSIYPNPVNDIVAVNYVSELSNFGTITICNDKGVLIMSKSMECLKGENKIEIQTDGFSNGMFVVTLYDSVNAYHTRFIKE